MRRAVRIAEGRDPEPSLAILDSQSVRTTSTSPAATRGFDVGKKIKGRKRHLLVDVLGLMLLVLVTSAGAQDRDAVPRVYRDARTKSARLSKVLVDSIYKGTSSTRPVASTRSPPRS